MRRALLATLCFAVGACTKQSSTDNSPRVTLDDARAVLPFEHPPLVGTGGGFGGGNGSGGGGDSGTGGGSGSLSSASTRRLSIAQLTSSLPIVLGGKTWTVGSASGFALRSATLGKADYIGIVDESLEPSPMFQKFMMDAAVSGCTNAVNADAALAANQRVLMRFVSLTDTVKTNAAGVDDNLRYLKLRFHGVKLGSSDAATLDGLRTVFTAAVTGVAGTGTPSAAAVREGWRAVCVALLTAPEYHLY
jgi:hypothetical protein